MNLFQRFTIKKDDRDITVVEFEDGCVVPWHELPDTFRNPVVDALVTIETPRPQEKSFDDREWEFD